MQNWHTEKIDYLRFWLTNKEDKLIKDCIIIKVIWKTKIIWISKLINIEVNQTKWKITTTKYGVIKKGKEIGDDEGVVVIEKGKKIGDEGVVAMEKGKEIGDEVVGKE